MLDARALLETLEEYFTVHMLTPPKQRKANATAGTAVKVSVSLNDTIVPTAFQAMAHSLAQCVPTASRTQGTLHPHQQDWLDNDVRHLLHDASVPATWKRVLPYVPLWHTTAACAPPIRIFIYTDGSATSSSRDIAPAAWAFTVWFQCHDPPCFPFYVGGCAHTTAPPDSEYHLGESDESALTGELLALAWATVWALEVGSTYSTPIEFRYDATSAGGGVFGTSRCPKSAASVHGPALAPFAVQLRQCLENRCLVLHTHVKGHAGHLGNEMCDLMSKHSRRHPSPPYERMLPRWPNRWWAHPLWEWGWMAGLDSPMYPCLSALEAEAARLQAREVHPTVPCMGQQAKTYRRAEVTYHIAAASYNVLTLFDPSAPKGRQARRGQTGLLTMGKRDVLKAQFLAKDLWLVGLQETRLPDTATLPDKDFWMYSSGATAQGHGGCSLWVSKRHPYATEKNGVHRISSGDIVITSRSERHLQAHIEAPRLSLTVLVAHAPKAENGDDRLVRDFWRDREQELLKRPARADFLILADANSHLGSHNTTAVGTAGAESENLEGACFHGFLHRVNGFLPSTFPDMHTGSHWTWYAPGPQPAKHRIDYIVLPIAWGMLGPQSWVWESFEALQARQDHLPVCLRIHFVKNASPACHTTSHRKAVRPPRDLDAQTKVSFGLQVLTMPTRPWEEDVDTHYTQWSGQLKSLAQQLSAPASRLPTNSYLSADTMVIVDRRAALRLYLRQESVERERRLKMIAYAAFILHTRGEASTEAAQRRAAQWLKDIDYSIAQAVERMNELTVAIKAAVRRDRLTYLQGLVQEVTLQDLRQPKALFAAVRRAFPAAAAARKSKFQPLPAVLKADGELAQTPEERVQRWTAYFQEQEGGLQVTDEQYLRFFASPSIPVGQNGPVFDIKAVPTLAELEGQILTAKYGKACGPDSLTAEIFRTAPAQCARVMYALNLKSALGLREPSEWRGGAFMCLAKRASASLQCKSFRSILLANVAAKTHHRLLRNKLAPSFACYKTELQAGQLPGVGVDTLSLLVRTYQLRAQHMRQACAVTYYDVKSAFYRVLRQILLPTQSGPSDAGFLKLLYDIGVPDTALPELMQHLHNMTVLADAQVTPHMQAQIADLFRGSWFRLDACGPLVATFKGTRPGDPLADLLFGFTFSAYLRGAEQELHKRGLATCAPAFEGVPLWPEQAQAPSIGCVAWADDYTHLQMNASFMTLLRNVSLAISVLVSQATSLGMELTFADDKTAILLSSGCPRQGVDLLLPDEEGRLSLQVRDEVAGKTHWVPVVDCYRHLGSITVANACAGPEIQFRYAQAQAALRPLKARLFASRQVPLDLRRTLLRSLIISRYVFSCSTLVLQVKQYRRKWGQLYVQLWRGLQKRDQASKQAHSYEVLRQAEATSPLLALAYARAIFFKRVYLQGPDTLKFLLQAHWCEQPSQSWLGQLRGDIQAVAVYVEAARAIAALTDPVRALCEAYHEDPTWWPKQVHKASEAFKKDLQTWALQALGDLSDDTITLDRIQRQFRPSVQIVRWVTDYVSGASKETYLDIQQELRPDSEGWLVDAFS
ncbi:LINE-1 retrotransposable element ORF2 protein [Symbiodinium microadriaticum]|uniref:LINE-1 retrotransposable element ORF2 protein n=1 Tax=Symbiodinium microadriaticum TaxID=2951 RepID=A0A1Q9ERZ7_SYMMI|nr:LINE-1 retrotransposable element ORF2 protein [Symbiodinium microadriaticum]